MKLELIGHNSLYPVEQLQLSLFPQETEGEALSAVYRGADTITFFTRITIGDKVTCGNRRLPVKEDTTQNFYRMLQQSYYEAALPHLPEVPAWGALAGVRPTKLSTRRLLEGATRQEAEEFLRDTVYVTEPRIRLALDCSQSSVAAVKKTTPQDISLYVGIPFCPTRCSYCSFVSRTVGKKTGLLEEYLQALLQELEITGRLLESSGKTVRTLYIGGGTPSTLSASQLQTLLSGIRSRVDLSRCLEFTVEGGRPDTLDEEKFAVMRANGADRVSINPQTMEDSVLKACGRPHTASDVLRVYRQAVDAGFTDINMDLIAGLPTDSFAGFRRSLEAVLALSPSNITVHTLALKKGADLFEKRENLSSRQEVAQMVDFANATLYDSGYKPYYLYRQKYMSGSFENVGWSKNGRDCLYNIYMMEELHSIVSLGGGGMNKVNLPGGRLQRFHNPKFPEEYIRQLDSVLAQKEELFTLMKEGI